MAFPLPEVVGDETGKRFAGHPGNQRTLIHTPIESLDQPLHGHFEVHNGPVFLHEREVVAVTRRPPSGGDEAPSVLIHQGPQHVPLPLPEALLAVPLEEIGDAAAPFLPEHGVRVEKGQVHPAGQSGATGAFPHSHVPHDEHALLLHAVKVTPTLLP